MRNLIIIVLACIGFLLCALMIYDGQKKVVFVPSIQSPPSPPYASYIAAQGMIESAYKNIPIGSSYSDVITEVFVLVADQVKKGARLFKTDTRLFEAQLAEAIADQKIAQEEYENQTLQFSFYQDLCDKNAVSKQAYTLAEYNKRIAAKKLEKARALAETYKVSIERSYVCAPIDGEVLQLNIRVGQYALQVGLNEPPLILFGDPHYFHVRIDIDEEDSWRYESGQEALAFVRGNKNIKIPLEFVYSEPYVVAKKSLTGDDIQRVDTRVMQVVYRFKKKNLPVLIGQLLDIYIKAKPHEGNA